MTLWKSKMNKKEAERLKRGDLVLCKSTKEVLQVQSVSPYYFLGFTTCVMVKAYGPKSGHQDYQHTLLVSVPNTGAGQLYGSILNQLQNLQ